MVANTIPWQHVHLDSHCTHIRLAAYPPYIHRHCDHTILILGNITTNKLLLTHQTEVKPMGLWTQEHLTSFSLAHLMKSVRNFMTEALASLWSREHAAIAQHRRGLAIWLCRKDAGDRWMNLAVKGHMIYGVQHQIISDWMLFHGTVSAIPAISQR